MSVLLRVCSDYWGMVGLVLTALGGVFVFTDSWQLAIVLLVVSAALWTVHAVRALRARRVVATGCSVEATVLGATVCRYTSISTSTSQYGPDDPSLLHPTVLWFTYQYDGHTYNGKSGLLWAAPQYAVGQQITIHILEEYPERYAL